MGGFTFNGTSTQSLGLLVTALNPYNSATRKVDKFTIPYRNGDLIIDSGTYENIRVGYEISVIRNTKATCDAINEWLSGSQGYCILTDTYNPEIFRVGYMADSIEYVLTALYREGRSTIEFDCLPQKYLVSNQPMTFSSTADTTTDTTMSLSTVPTPINISLNGNTTQEGSSGKNIFDFTYWANNINTSTLTKTVSGNSITLTALRNDAYTSYNNSALFPKVTANTSYTFSWDVVSYTSQGEIYIFAENDAVITHIPAINNHYVTFNSGSNTVIKFRLGVLNNGGTITFNNLQIEKGSTATAYEPHISPTNPQVIHNVSGNNEVKVIGKNVFDYLAWANGTAGIRATTSVSGNNFTITATGADAYTQYGGTYDALFPRVTANTTYTFSWKVVSNTGTGEIYIFSESGSVITHIPAINNHYITFNSGESTYIKFRLGVTNSGDSITFTDLQFEKGSARTYYEPYTRQSYPLYLPVENLLDSDLLLVSNWTKSGDVYSGDLSFLYNAYGTNTNGIYNTFTANTQYSFSLDLKADATTQGLLVRFVYTDNTNSQVTCQNANTTDFVHYTLTSTSGKSILKLIFSYANGMTVHIKNMQLEKGTNANQYNPYGNPYIELNKIGTYQDYIYKNGGKWYVHKEINNLNLGTITTWAKSSSGNKYYTTITPLYKWASNDVMLCDSYTFDGIGDGTRGYYGANGTFRYGYNATSSSPYSELYFTNESISTLADFKTSVSGVFLYYPLRTSTNTEITDTTLINQLNNIEKAYSYDGVTNILQVSNDNGFMLEVVSLHGTSFVSNNRGEPIITVNQTGLIYLNGVAINVTQAPMTINSQTMQCYNGTINLNNYAEMDDFPMIKKGGNTVGSSMTISVVPNYWKL